MSEVATVREAVAGWTPLVYLLAGRLRDIAWQARSAHLAEHCVIVGVGTAARLIYALIADVLATYARKLGSGDWSVERR